MKVSCAFSLESPQQCDPNRYTLNMKKKIILNYPKLSEICDYGICSNEPKYEFETAVVKRAISVRATEVLLYLVIINVLTVP